MNIYLIKSEQPKCKICGLLIKEWNPFADSHTHIHCEANRISDKLIDIIKQHFNH